MLSYKEFYFWLDGYLHDKLENKHIDIAPIVEKMNQVVGEQPKFNIGEQLNPITLPPQPKNPFDIQF